MKKLVVYMIALAITSASCFSSSTSTKLIQGQSIQFNCITSLDTIISGIPSIINSTTMDLTNACNSLSSAAQAYEDSAEESTNLQVQADYYYNAAQAYLKACNIILITKENFGAIGNAQNIAYIQSYRCAALQAFNQSFEAYLSLCLSNLNTTLTASIAANAELALADFLTQLINLNTQQSNLIHTLAQSSPNFSYSEQSNKICNAAIWYPVALPGEEIPGCQYQKFQLPANPTSYASFAAFCDNPSYNLREMFGFTGNSSMFGVGTPGQQILNEGPADDNTNNHMLGMLSSPTEQGTYICNNIIGSSKNPLYDMGYVAPSLGSKLLPYSQILDPYSPLDPKANSASSSYDENFTNTMNIIPQAQYIFTTPTPTSVQNLHDTIRDYMYSADINKMDSYAYNAYINITAKHLYPADIIPALTKMGNARMNVINCYEGAIIKTVVGLTGQTSISATSLNNQPYVGSADQIQAITAAECILIIMPMYNSIIQQIVQYDIPLLSALSAIQSNTSNSTNQANISGSTQQSSDAINKAQSAYQKALAAQSENQQAAMQKTLNQQAANNSAISADAALQQIQSSLEFVENQNPGKDVASYQDAFKNAQKNAAAIITQAQQILSSAPNTIKQSLNSGINAIQQALATASQTNQGIQQQASLLNTRLQNLNQYVQQGTTADQQAHQAALTGDQKTAEAQAQQIESLIQNATKQSQGSAGEADKLDLMLIQGNSQIQAILQAITQLTQQINPPNTSESSSSGLTLEEVQAENAAEAQAGAELAATEAAQAKAQKTALQSPTMQTPTQNPNPSATTTSSPTIIQNNTQALKAAPIDLTPAQIAQNAAIQAATQKIEALQNLVNNTNNFLQQENQNVQNDQAQNKQAQLASDKQAQQIAQSLYQKAETNLANAQQALAALTAPQTVTPQPTPIQTPPPAEQQITAPQPPTITPEPSATTNTAQPIQISATSTAANPKIAPVNSSPISKPVEKPAKRTEKKATINTGTKNSVPLENQSGVVNMIAKLFDIYEKNHSDMNR